jgi:hypothetical protein
MKNMMTETTAIQSYLNNWKVTAISKMRTNRLKINEIPNEDMNELPNDEPIPNKDINELPNDEPLNTKENYEEYTEYPYKEPITIDNINIMTEMNASHLAVQEEEEQNTTNHIPTHSYNLREAQLKEWNE